jgi:uncharacterized membrane protein YbaN (DUF454 family)
MSVNTFFQKAGIHSAKTVTNDGPGFGLPAITPVSVSLSRSCKDSAYRAVERDSVAVGPWIGCCETTGVIEIHDPRLLRRGREAFCRALVEAAVDRFQVIRAEVCLESSTCRLEFGPDRFDRTEMAKRVAAAVRTATPAAHNETGHSAGVALDRIILSASASPCGSSNSAVREQVSDDPASLVRMQEASNRPHRLSHLAMAGGSFVLAVGGFILPGIPTLPFLIMTGRHAVHASARIERLVRRQQWCADLLAPAEPPTGPKLDWRSLSRMIGLGLLLAAGFWILHPPLPLVIAVELGLMAFLGWQELSRSSLAAGKRGAFA